MVPTVSDSRVCCRFYHTVTIYIVNIGSHWVTLAGVCPWDPAKKHQIGCRRLESGEGEGERDRVKDRDRVRDRDRDREK